LKLFGPMIRGEKTIGIIPVGTVPNLVLEIVASNIDIHLSLPTEILSMLAPPAAAFDEGRQQYDAGKVLQAMSSLGLERHKKVVAICNQDLFVPIVTHVYGEAQQNGKYAIVSLFRLHRQSERSKQSSLLYERTVKITLHEIGHLFNLFHCEDRRCLMHFSSTLEDLDATPMFFCNYCDHFFKVAAVR